MKTPYDYYKITTPIEETDLGWYLQIDSDSTAILRTKSEIDTIKGTAPKHLWCFGPVNSFYSYTFPLRKVEPEFLPDGHWFTAESIHMDDGRCMNRIQSERFIKNHKPVDYLLDYDLRTGNPREYCEVRGDSLNGVYYSVDYENSTISDISIFNQNQRISVPYRNRQSNSYPKQDLPNELFIAVWIESFQLADRFKLQSSKLFNNEVLDKYTGQKGKLIVYASSDSVEVDRTIAEMSTKSLKEKTAMANQNADNLFSFRSGKIKKEPLPDGYWLEYDLGVKNRGIKIERKLKNHRLIMRKEYNTYLNKPIEYFEASDNKLDGLAYTCRPGTTIINSILKYENGVIKKILY